MKQTITIDLQIPASCSEVVFTQVADWVHAVFPHYSPSVSGKVVRSFVSVDDLEPIELD